MFVSVISDIILVVFCKRCHIFFFFGAVTLLMYFLKNRNIVLLLLFIIVQLYNHAKQHEKLNNIYDLYHMILNNVILRVTLNTVDVNKFTENFV